MSSAPASPQNAVILAVGSELLTPQKLDTNSLWLTDQLNMRGVEVVLKMIAGDNRAALVAALRFALTQARFVLLSGGLGPTEDDVTRDAVAEVCGRALIYDETIAAAIAERFRHINRPMAAINQRQAYRIEGADVLPNPRGTAPGQWIRHGDAHIVLLPGPPKELQGVWNDHCVSRLDALLPAQVIRTRFYRVAGMPESELDQLISPVYSKYSNPATTILASIGDIQVHLRARCATGQEAEALLAEVGDPILALLGDRVYSRNGDPLEVTVGNMLRDRGLTLAVAESCTGGLLAERLTSVAGSSDYFVGGFLTYSYAAKTRLLSVDPEMLRTHHAVSEPVAAAMALGAARNTGAVLGLSVTGVAGPSSGGETEPVGTVFLGLASGDDCQVKRFLFGGDRDRIRAMAAQTALDLLRRFLLRRATQ